MINNQANSQAFQSWLDDTRKGFDYVEIDGIGLYTIGSFQNSGMVRHCFSSRKGGVSTGSYAGLNMSWTRTDSQHSTRRNYELVAAALGIAPADMVVVDGDHGTTVKSIDESHKGNGLYHSWEDCDKFDAMTTNKPGIALCTIHGDCTPIFVLDPIKKAICMCHSGWRGTADGMPAQSVGIMAGRYGSHIQDLYVGIGPCIGGCCFEVQPDVSAQFDAAFPDAGCVLQGKQPRVDIMRAAAWQIFSAGVPAANVTIADLCTCCDSEHFHSFRRDGKGGGSMAGVLQLI